MLEEKARILVVDDEGENLHLMEALLLPLGYEVILAGDGEEALAKVKETPPNVILLDTLTSPRPYSQSERNKCQQYHYRYLLSQSSIKGYGAHGHSR